MLDAAGYQARDGVRFHLTMKTSTEESTRLLAAVLQQQLRDVGIALDIRTFEFATFFANVTSGAFQVYSLRWIGGNEVRIFLSIPFTPTDSRPKAPTAVSIQSEDRRVDRPARRETDQNARRRLYFEVQEVLAQDVPYIDLWYFDNVLVHTRRVRNVTLNPSGNYDFLKTAEISSQ